MKIEQIKKKPILIVMTRWPAIGRCKKRLSLEIGIKKAAYIQKRLTFHTLAVAKFLEKEGLIKLRLAVSGLSSKGAERWRIQEGINNIDHQGEGTLGLRMRKQIIRAQGHYKRRQKTARPTLLIGSDIPSLSHLDLIKAIDVLKNNELVLGPAKDGGYWLIGLSGELLKPVATWPFCGIPWGTNQVLRNTTYKARAAGVRHQLLHQKNDLDQIEDLLPWQA